MPDQRPAVVVITTDPDVALAIFPTTDVDLFVYPGEETPDDMRRDADILAARGMTDAAAALRHLAATTETDLYG
jgi:hypothetical protein